MSQSWPGPDPAETPAASDGHLRQSAMIAYALMLSALAIGFTALIAVIFAYIRRTDAVGTIWESHFRNVIVVFWTMCVAAVIAFVTFPIVVGAYLSGAFAWPPLPALVAPMLFWMFGFPIIALWFLYRMIKGLVRATDGRPY